MIDAPRAIWPGVNTNPFVGSEMLELLAPGMMLPNVPLSA